MKGIGRQLQIGIAKEAVRGVAESAAAYWIPFSSMSLDERIELATENQTYGVIEESSNQSILKKWAEGSVKAPIGDKHFPLVLLAALGALSTGDNADTDASVKDHTITVLQSAQHPTLTVFGDDPIGGQDYKHAGSAIENLSIAYEQKKLIEYALKFKSKKGATATLTPATTAENKFLPQHVTFKMASALSGLGAASAVVIKSLKLTINKSLEDDDVLGSIEPADFLNKQFSIEGELEAVWQNESDFKAAALAGTAKAMRIDLKNTDVVIGSAANPEVKIDLAKVVFQEITRPVALNDVIMQTLSFKAHYSISDGKMVQIVATNTVASY